MGGLFSTFFFLSLSILSFPLFSLSEERARHDQNMVDWAVKPLLNLSITIHVNVKFYTF